MFAVSKLFPPNFCAAQPAADPIVSAQAVRQYTRCNILRTRWDLSQHVSCWEGAEQDRNLTLGPPLALGDEWNQ
jgi:hypothetical protein